MNETPGKTDEPRTGTYLERLGDFEREAFAHPTLPCLLRLEAAKLMRLGDMLHERLVAKLHQCSSAEAIDRARPGVDTLLKVSRQVDRYIRLGNDLQDN